MLIKINEKKLTHISGGYAKKALLAKIDTGRTKWVTTTSNDGFVTNYGTYHGSQSTQTYEVPIYNYIYESKDIYGEVGIIFESHVFSRDKYFSAETGEKLSKSYAKRTAKNYLRSVYGYLMV